MIIGVTGGVGSGKSTILSILKQEFDAKIIIADELGHLAIQPGQEPVEKIRLQFGDDFILPDGNVDRDKLAHEIYSDDEKREQLNGMIHPFVFREIKKKLKEWENEPLIVIETAIMFETGCDKLCDEIWGVYVEREARINRLSESRGYPREKSEFIINKQLSDDDLKAKCDKIIDNNGKVENILFQLQDLLEKKGII